MGGGFTIRRDDCLSNVPCWSQLLKPLATSLGLNHVDNVPMSYSLNSLQAGYVGDYLGDYYGDIKGDTRSLEHGSHGQKFRDLKAQESP